MVKGESRNILSFFESFIIKNKVYFLKSFEKSENNGKFDYFAGKIINEVLGKENAGTFETVSKMFRKTKSFEHFEKKQLWTCCLLLGGSLIRLVKRSP